MWNTYENQDFSADDWLRLLDEMPDEMGLAIKKQRERLGLSQRELADRMNSVQTSDVWHQTTVAKTEGGTRPLKWREAFPLARALELMRVDHLLGPSNPMSAALLQAWKEAGEKHLDMDLDRARKALASDPVALERFEAAVNAWKQERGVNGPDRDES